MPGCFAAGQKWRLPHNAGTKTAAEPHGPCDIGSYSAVMQLTDPPARWVVTLNDGSEVEIWAHAVEGLSGAEDNRDYLFGVLMDVEPELQGEFEVTARTPSNPRRVEVAVARFPRSSVQDILGG